MDISVRLIDLTIMHPRLLWEDITAATVAILSHPGVLSPFPFDLAVEDLPGFGSAQVQFVIDPVGVASGHVSRLQRTYEPSRLVELAAIAIVGLGLYHGGGHEIMDIALRGSGADYLVDESNYLLEVAGRSRRSDFGVAWQQRWERLTNRIGRGFYVCVAEFETPAGRLAFRA
jgi:hypothetical protein